LLVIVLRLTFWFSCDHGYKCPSTSF